MTRLRTFVYVPMLPHELEAASPALRASLTQSRDEEGREVLVLEVLKYTHGHADVPLTPDQKLMNRKFNTECHRLWNAARRDLDALMDLLMEAELRKLDSLPPDAPKPSDATIAFRCLEKLSIGRIRKWAEEDVKDFSEQKKKIRELKYLQWVEGRELIDGGLSVYLIRLFFSCHSPILYYLIFHSFSLPWMIIACHPLICAETNGRVSSGN
jgi:hypothetical protein